MDWTDFLLGVHVGLWGGAILTELLERIFKKK